MAGIAKTPTSTAKTLKVSIQRGLLTYNLYAHDDDSGFVAYGIPSLNYMFETSRRSFPDALQDFDNIVGRYRMTDVCLVCNL